MIVPKRLRDRPRPQVLALAAILLLGGAIRLWGVFHDLPFSYFGDELHFMKLSMAMGTGDLNPHWFHKPALFMYLWFVVYGLYFVAGLAVGRFESTAEFGAHFLTSPGPFLLLGRLVVFATGVAMIWVVYRLGKRAFGEAAGLAGALSVAVLAPVVYSSQHMKTDVPAGFMIALSTLLYLRTHDDLRWRPLVWASLLAGLAMGTHYYAVVLVPTFAAMELWNGLGRRLPWRTVLLRGAAIPVLFVAGFFVSSPYNLLDRTWLQQNVTKVTGIVSPAPAQVSFEPDSRIAYTPGTLATFAGATKDFFVVLTGVRGMSLPLTVLALVGLAAVAARRETRWYAALLAIPCLIFFVAAITFEAYHVQPRHLNALYPLLAVTVWPGALLIARAVPRALLSRRGALAATLIAAACLPTAVESYSRNRIIMRQDSRLVSYRWIVDNLPRDSRILLDDYGPAVQPDARSATRQQALLPLLPRGPFTYHQATRLQLLRRYPPAEGRDITELGHQWWLRAEKTDAELRSNRVDLDMGNPLVSRQPKPLVQYADEGIRFVVTNSDARSKYLGPNPRFGPAFPSFIRFYQDLDGARLVHTFNPADWGGKGPVVWIYDLAALAHGTAARKAE